MHLRDIAIHKKISIEPAQKMVCVCVRLLLLLLLCVWALLCVLGSQTLARVFTAEARGEAEVGPHGEGQGSGRALVG